MTMLFLTGVPRSGLSMTAGLLAHAGAFTGKTDSPDINNIRGNFENTYIRDKIVKPYLRSLGVDHEGQNPLPNLEMLKPFGGLNKSLLEHLMSEGYTSGPAIYKDHRICLISPEWLNQFPTAKYVVVRRRSSEIVKSCMLTGYMTGFSTTQGWRDYVEYMLQYITVLKNAIAEEQVLDFWPTKVVEGDLTEAERLLDFCKLPLKPKALNRYLEERFYG